MSEAPDAVLERPPNSRERLILAAQRQIEVGDLSLVTARTICSEAGVSAPTLYHHFKDLPDLYCAVLQHLTEARLSGHPDEQQDPMAAITWAWDAQLHTARTKPGVTNLLNQLLSTGRIPEVMHRIYGRLETAFALTSQTHPLRIDAPLAAEIYWAAALGMCTLIAAKQHGAPFPDGASDLLREAVFARIFEAGSAPAVGREIRI